MEVIALFLLANVNGFTVPSWLWACWCVWLGIRILVSFMAKLADD